MPTNSYTITPEKFAALELDLANAGATMSFTDPTKNSGSFTPPGHSEISLGFAYANGTLQLTILHDSWFETAGEIWNSLAPYLEPGA